MKDNWEGGDKVKFRAWLLKAENYLHSGHDEIKGALQWAAKQSDNIDVEKMEEDCDDDYSDMPELEDVYADDEYDENIAVGNSIEV